MHFTKVPCAKGNSVTGWTRYGLKYSILLYIMPRRLEYQVYMIGARKDWQGAFWWVISGDGIKRMPIRNRK